MKEAYKIFLSRTKPPATGKTKAISKELLHELEKLAKYVWASSKNSLSMPSEGIFSDSKATTYFNTLLY